MISDPYSPYVHSPGMNPAGAAAYTRASRVNPFQPYVHSPGLNPAGAAAYTHAVGAVAPHLPAASGGGGASPDTLNFTNTPDEKQLIDGSFEVAGAKQTATDNALTRSATLRNLIQNALVNYGGKIPNLNLLDPTTGGNLLSEYVDDGTRDLAMKNSDSGIVGQHHFAHEQNLAALKASLAARGLSGGGQDTLESSNEGRTYASQVDQDQQDLYKLLSGGLTDFVNGYTTDQSGITGAATQAATRLAGTNAFDPTDVKAVKDPGFSFNGQAVFKDANGNYWTGDHQAVTSSQLQSTTAPPPATSPSAPALAPRGGGGRMVPA